MSDDIDDELEETTSAGPAITIPWADFMNPQLPLPGKLIPNAFGYRECSEEEYRAFPALNNSVLKCRTAHEMHRCLTMPQRSTAGLQLGTLVDLAVLTPKENWQDRFITFDPPTDSKGKAYKSGKKYDAAAAAAQIMHPDKMVVTQDALYAHAEALRRIYQAVVANPEALRDLEEEGWRQATGFYFHTEWGMWLKWRCDILPRHRHPERGRRIIDLKSTAHHPFEFFREAMKFRYFQQGTLYGFCDQLLMRQVFGQSAPVCSSFDFIIVADESKTKDRGAMCDVASFPLNPTINLYQKSNLDALGIAEGDACMGRVDLFRRSLLAQVTENPDPADFMAMRRVWPALEAHTAEKGRRIFAMEPKELSF